jgi:hypothetical protein
MQRPEHDFALIHRALYPPSSSSEVKNAWSYTSIPQYPFMSRCSVKTQGQLYLNLPPSTCREDTHREDSISPTPASSPWRWRQHGPPKRWYPTTTLHGVTIQNTSTWNITAVKASKLEITVTYYSWRMRFCLLLSSSVVLGSVALYCITLA